MAKEVRHPESFLSVSLHRLLSEKEKKYGETLQKYQEKSFFGATLFNLASRMQRQANGLPKQGFFLKKNSGHLYLPSLPVCTEQFFRLNSFFVVGGAETRPFCTGSDVW